MLILLILAAICMAMASVQIVKDHKKVNTKEKKSYSCIPFDAADRVNAFLDIDKSTDKEYKLAALVIVDEYGHKHIEDIDLRGDSAEPIKLSSFAFNKTKDKADAFLFDTGIINAIASKVNCVVEDNIERYYAFQLTLENILSGRHGKQKKSVVNKYVMLLDLNQLELSRIANLSF